MEGGSGENWLWATSGCHSAAAFAQPREKVEQRLRGQAGMDKDMPHASRVRILTLYLVRASRR